MSFISRTGERQPRSRSRTATVAPGPRSSPAATPPPLVDLDDEVLPAPELVGSKAAALARAARAGLPVLPGVVITTAATRLNVSDLEPVLDRVWEAMATSRRGGGLVVRSSSTVEDSETSSMAGMFTSVLDVRSRFDFSVAVRAVIGSGRLDGPVDGLQAAPMAVLVQPFLASSAGGVMFGIDPVDGSHNRIVVAASSEGPAAVVGGAVEPARYSLSRRGHQQRGSGPGSVLTGGELRALARLARQAERVFGGPQDIEWTLGPARPSERGTGNRLWLLQSRPITAVGDAASASGPLLGPGPVAETFPDPLSTLEQELWVEPLRKALSHSLTLAGTVSRRHLAASPILTVVQGRPAVDLDLLGLGTGRPSLLRRLDPRPRVRRLLAAWRVGRLRAALPGLATDLVAHADSDLLALPPTAQMTDGQLLRLLGRSGQALTALHGHEVLMGWLTDPGTSTTTAASVALRMLGQARRGGLTDAETVYHHPGVLALVAPRIRGSSPSLPPTDNNPPTPGPRGGGQSGPARAGRHSGPMADDGSAMLREALRLRVRWLQELTSVTAWALGERLAGRGVLTDAAQVRHLTLEELRSAVRTGARPPDIEDRKVSDTGAPLPARFRLSPAGAVVTVRDGKGSRDGAGVGAGGGRGVGRVHQGTSPSEGDVLVVRALEPGLAPLLPRLAGLVAETGSPLSHLAILAREFGVATAVGVEDALTHFPAGSTVVVDGTSGAVQVVDQSTVTV